MTRGRPGRGEAGCRAGRAAWPGGACRVAGRPDACPVSRGEPDGSDRDCVRWFDGSLSDGTRWRRCGGSMPCGHSRSRRRRQDVQLVGWHVPRRSSQCRLPLPPAAVSCRSHTFYGTAGKTAVQTSRNAMSPWTSTCISQPTGTDTGRSTSTSRRLPHARLHLTHPASRLAPRHTSFSDLTLVTHPVAKIVGIAGLFPTTPGKQKSGVAATAQEAQLGVAGRRSLRRLREASAVARWRNAPRHGPAASRPQVSGLRAAWQCQREVR